MTESPRQGDREDRRHQEGCSYSFQQLSAEAEHRMREWAVENSRDKRPVHSYTLEKFGFTPEGLRSDFANYRAFLETL